MSNQYMITTAYPVGSINIKLIKFIIPLDSRGFYHLIDDTGTRYRISGHDYDYLLERGIKDYEINKSNNREF